MTLYGYPSDRYHCLLDEQPYYLVPPRLFRPEEPGALVVNPACWFSWLGVVPANMADSVHAADGLLSTRCMVWVPDAATGGVWPYWIGQDYIRYFAKLAPGRPVTASLPADVRWVLQRAEILVTPDHAQRRKHEWDCLVGARSTQLRQGFAPIANLVPPFHLGALRRFYRSAVRRGQLRPGDDKVARRFVAHNEPVAGFVHRQLLPAVGELVRARIKRSYCSVEAYQSGSVLQRHTDPEQCQYSMTLCVDASPEPTEQCPWPINLDTGVGTVRIWQYLGEGLVYRGGRLPHHRDRLPDGHTSTSLLLHYVDQGFRGRLN